MKFPRIPATFGALVVVAGSFAAFPTRARANDVALAFGARSVTPITFTATAPSFTAAQLATAIRSRSLLSSLGLHEEHEGLGGNIAWSSNNVWSEHEDGDGWRHHDDDGDGETRHSGTVPEPSTGLLVFSGISALAGWRLRRLHSANLA
jgi:hypothetical protein